MPHLQLSFCCGAEYFLLSAEPVKRGSCRQRETEAEAYPGELCGRLLTGGSASPVTVKSRKQRELCGGPSSGNHIYSMCD